MLCAPLILLALVSAHADRRLASRNHHAVLWGRPLSATGRGIYTSRDLLITAVANATFVFTVPGAATLGTANKVPTAVRMVALVVAGTL